MPECLCSAAMPRGEAGPRRVLEFQAMPIPLDVRKRPVDVKVRVTSGEGVDVTWSDGHKSHYEFIYLREQCPCAHCKDERAKQEQGEGLHPPGKSAPPPAFPMYKPKPKATAANAVGNYAIHIDFSDGHTAGIYSFDYLREICPCAECAQEFRELSKLT
jgi:DUF971 family protein